MVIVSARRCIRRSVFIACFGVCVLHGEARAQDSSAVQRSPQGLLVDFQDVDLRLVIAALAEGANVNVTYAELPSRRVTLRLRQPVPLIAVPALIRSLAQSNGLRVIEDGGLLRLEPQDGRGTGGTRDSTAASARLYVHPLRHAKAARMAATLQSIFGAGVSEPYENVPLGQSLTDRLRSQSLDPGRDSAGRGESTPRGAGAGDATALRAQLQGPIQIVPEETTNALVVRATPEDWETIKAAVDAMDRRPLQALIEVVIAEVRTTDETKLGISSKVTSTNASGNKVGGELKSGIAGDFLLNLAQRGPTFSADVALSALASRGDVRILSRPLLLAQNNQEARILVGEQRPFVQVFRSLPTDNAIRDQIVQYRDVATTLTIKPTINPDGYVNLQVLQEVSNATDATQFGAPIISTREASSFLFVRDGQTAVLGGLVSRQTDKVRTGIPILSRIPWLGRLFGSTTDAATTSELFLFLTPHVIASDADADRLRDALQRVDSDSTGLRPGERSTLPVRRP